MTVIINTKATTFTTTSTELFGMDLVHISKAQVIELATSLQTVVKDLEATNEGLNSEELASDIKAKREGIAACAKVLDEHKEELAEPHYANERPRFDVSKPALVSFTRFGGVKRENLAKETILDALKGLQVDIAAQTELNAFLESVSIAAEIERLTSIKETLVKELDNLAK